MNTENPRIIVTTRNTNNEFLIIPNYLNINTIPAIIISRIEIIASPLFNKKNNPLFLRIAYKFTISSTSSPTPLWHLG